MENVASPSDNGPFDDNDCSTSRRASSSSSPVDQTALKSRSRYNTVNEELRDLNKQQRNNIPDLRLLDSTLSEATFESGVASLQRSLFDEEEDDDINEGDQIDNKDENGDKAVTAERECEESLAKSSNNRRRRPTSPNENCNHESSNDNDDNISQVSPPPFKRRRRHSDPMSLTSSIASFATLEESPSTALARPEWEAFVRHGACLKSFLKDALQRLKQAAISPSFPTHSSKGLDVDGATDNTDTTKHDDHHHEAEPGNSVMLHPNHSSNLAREKVAQCMILEKKLQEGERQAATLIATNEALREERQSTLSRLDKASTALRMAGQNAAQARADADAAEACAAGLASQLQALKTVVDETKQASQVLMEEHTQMLATTQAMEEAYMATQAELVKCQTQTRRELEGKLELEHKVQELQETQAALNRLVRHQKEELQTLQMRLGEQEALEQARQHRMTQLEEELRNAQTLLVQATATVAEQQTTLQTHQDSVRTLESENDHLYQQYAQQQEWSKVEHDRLQASWTKAEQERQSYRLQATASEEQVQRLLLQQADKDKQILQLQQQVTQLERQLQQQQPHITDEEYGNSLSLHNRDLAFAALPPIAPTATVAATTNDANVTQLQRCYICFKPAFGLMKSCQCVNTDCDKRAHSLCVHKSQAGPSVAHPGTPAPRLPLILCSGNFTANNNNKATDTAMDTTLEATLGATVTSTASVSPPTSNVGKG